MADSSVIGDVTLNASELQVENDILKEQVKQLSTKLEELTQETYGLRSRLQVALNVESDYQRDLDLIQQQESKLRASNDSFIHQLREEHAKALQEVTSKVECLECELEEEQTQCASLKAQLEEERKRWEGSGSSSETITALRADLQDVVNARDADREACQQHQELNRFLLQEKMDLSSQLECIQEQLEVVEARYAIAKSDLMEQAGTLENLRETLAVTQNELACIKAAPSDQIGRGNSLFAEVEDKRQAMVKRVSTLSAKYKQMKLDYTAKCTEITKLKTENVRLCRKWEEEQKERDNREVWLVDNFEIRIKELEKTVDQLKKEEKPVFVEGDAQIIKYADHVLQTSRTELRKLREEMEWRSSERLNEAKALYSTRCSLQTLRSQFMSVQAENCLLRDRLEQANISDLPPPRPFTCVCHLKDTEEECAVPAMKTDSSKSLTSHLGQILPKKQNTVKTGKSLLPVVSALSFISSKPAIKEETVLSPIEQTHVSSLISEDISEQSPASRAVNSLSKLEDLPNEASSLATELELKKEVTSELFEGLEMSPPSDTTAGLPLASESTPSRSLGSDLTPCQSLASELASSQALASELASSQALASELASSQALASELASSQSLASELAPSQSLASELAPSQSLASELAPSQSLASELVSSRSLASESASSQSLKISSYGSRNAKPRRVIAAEMKMRDSNNPPVSYKSHSTAKIVEASVNVVTASSSSASDDQTKDTSPKQAPRRSILSKPALRPSFCPLEDLKTSRSVRFAEAAVQEISESETSCASSVLVESSNKSEPIPLAPDSVPKRSFKKVGPQKPYTIRFISSKENVGPNKAE